MTRRQPYQRKKKTKKDTQYFFRNPRFDTKLMDMKTIDEEGFDDIELQE
jgi:hypothetical protein